VAVRELVVAVPVDSRTAGAVRYSRGSSFICHWRGCVRRCLVDLFQKVKPRTAVELDKADTQNTSDVIEYSIRPPDQEGKRRVAGGRRI